MPDQTTVTIRVRYPECDPQGVAHHSVYAVWMEIARTELLRQRGHAYRDLEARGIKLVVARMAFKFRRPARYDDEIAVHCALKPTHGGKLIHEYRVRRGAELLAEAETTLVCVDAQGAMRRMPPEILA